ncbi:hypothetical protein LTS03_005647 [Exophiala xenobiotica]|nr:hypothetical protein LTR72_009449 [Exophiala xenobiotica]KAK5249874.1 hypothetical protein LTS06_005229 [Exophiala xenobiotica]KAK5291936.1 hypothetical protein LTR14_005485 [Exophiala xenobiotica]KAK5329545.1 hypothetical protein LTR93_001132 [Exophiala xenobiotica]KAK5346938.1 hypothetical protein LTR61_009379 [Exophiala xenobiotica]
MLGRSLTTALIALSTLSAYVLAVPVASEDTGFKKFKLSMSRRDVAGDDHVQAIESTLALANLGADGDDFGFALGMAVAELSTRKSGSSGSLDLSATLTADEWANFLKACQDAEQCRVLDQNMQLADASVARWEKSPIPMINNWKAQIGDFVVRTVDTAVDVGKTTFEIGFIELPSNAMSSQSLTVTLNRTEKSPVTSTPDKITCGFNYIWDDDRQVGRAYLSTINGTPFGAALNDDSGAKVFSGAPIWASNQLMGGISFEVSKFILKVGAKEKDTQAAIWVKQDNKDKLLYKTSNYA